MSLELLSGHEVDFFILLGLSLLFGFAIGTERETRGKPAGVSTNTFVIGGSAMFTFVSIWVDPSSPSRIAAQVVSGVGFLGAGMILKSDKEMTVTNLTTAAGIWFSAAIGMALGFGWYLIAGGAALFAVVVPRLPHISKHHHDR